MTVVEKQQDHLWLTDDDWGEETRQTTEIETPLCVGDVPILAQLKLCLRGR